MTLYIGSNIQIGDSINISAPLSATIPTLTVTSNTWVAYEPSASITYDITDDGGSPVIESGVIWATQSSNAASYSQSIEICSGSSSISRRMAFRVGNGDCGNEIATGQLGNISQNFTAGPLFGSTMDVVCYAINAAGIGYTTPLLTWYTVICLAEGTMITLADDTTKPIEHVTMLDKLKVWNFDDGVFTSASPAWIKRKQTASEYNLLTFSDGSTLKTVGQHRIFNKQTGSFTYPMTDDTPIGTITVNKFGNELTLLDKKVITESVNNYNIITDTHFNMYADSILTSCRLNNLYPINDMKFVKDSRTIKQFPEIAEKWYNSLRLGEQNIDGIPEYIQNLEATQSDH